ncbi:type II toxin-antitoxin system HipA family toxin YjjJ [Luteibacter anthropi]|uniref:Type II toxin-antitoxin system HipA family toxin YjjJ n=1 Tax=Luteibacter anthropi TaxID=564369 RepID=A0A7X5UE35_9GAMM|nr:type II toxin-antitoxin system HipA family toxin YjjJ [Luteibacter anthropi]NII08803.1 type II toxin-antitoxin system HipA family toxin YjjJ [Luteibacter anthropi]
MALPTDNPSPLLALLQRHGPSSAQQLASALGVSQPTVSRMLDSEGDRAIRIGRARRTRYAAVRNVRGLGTHWPLFRIDARGRPQAFGEMRALYGAGVQVSIDSTPDWFRDEFVDGVFPGVPWFLDDQRPQGFLGRLFAQRWARELGLHADVLMWDDDAVLTALLLQGGDEQGNFVLGEGALERALTGSHDEVSVSDRDTRYTVLAEKVLAGESVGSSAAGEQPKFTAMVRDADGSPRHVIVKFSESVGSSPAARRWADLLICEHLADELLAEHGDHSAKTNLVWSQDRLCLEVSRFDRLGAYGRRGCVTLAAWSDAHDGERDDWPRATERMRRAGWVQLEDVERVRRRWWFGRMIGNTDMHFGNLSFFLDDSLPMSLTPSYDMLPMLYRPASNGAIVARDYAPPVPMPADMAVWQEVAGWSESYWRTVSNHAELSREMRDIARKNRILMSQARQRFSS